MACRFNHAELKRNHAAWKALPWVGIQDRDTDYPLFLRNCPCCGSTLAKAVR